MKVNHFNVPVTAQEYIKNQFKDKVSFKHITDETISVIFDDELTSLDLTNIFFGGAYWGLNISNQKTT